jgi:hypothetical protein
MLQFNTIIIIIINLYLNVGMYVVLACTNVNKNAIKVMQLFTRKPGSLVFSQKGYVCICKKLVFFPSKHIFVSYHLLKFFAECGFIFKREMSSSRYREKNTSYK